MNRRIRLAISTCPNDTFAFHGLIHRKVDWQGLDFEIQLLDISQLNRGLLKGDFDIAKASFHAALVLANDFAVLRSGAALGFGNGPLLLAADEQAMPQNDDQTTLCPGELTTATLLFRMFYGQTQIRHVVFSDIMPMLQKKVADFGVCIHEGRFTYQQQGLALVEDLGLRWERETGCPLPLGGILGHKQLGETTLRTAQSVILDSLRYGMENRNETVSTMNQYAQEFDVDVLFQHVDLYVNQWTLDLGEVGESALKKLYDLAKQMSLVSTEPIQILN